MDTVITPVSVLQAIKNLSPPFPTFPHPAQPSDASMHGQSTSSLNIAEKKLPAVPLPPLGTLGLDLHGASYARSPRQAAVNENDSRRSER